MARWQTDNLTISTDMQGADEYTKVSYPIRYGIYDEIKTRDYTFQFNRNGEIKHIQGRRHDWPSPAEWLKRTAGNDWVYYSSGNYSETFERFGEYYFPCLSYPSNSLMANKPFRYQGIQRAFSALEGLLPQICNNSKGIPTDISQVLARISVNDTKHTSERANKLHRLLGGRMSVLPPDTRHSDYDVIPLILADGCLYNCGFCSIKSGRDLTPRPKANIIEQMEMLKVLYGADLPNYSSLFLGQHDALAAPSEMIKFATHAAYNAFDFAHSYMKKSTLFLFGSVDSLLGSDESLFQFLNSTPFFTYINVGFESANADTLAMLRKPVPVGKILDAFELIFDMNRKYEKIEVSANFVIARDLPADHLVSLYQLAGKERRRLLTKGCIYVSPISNDRRSMRQEERTLLVQFDRIRSEIALPTYLYLIQRL